MTSKIHLLFNKLRSLCFVDYGTLGINSCILSILKAARILTIHNLHKLWWALRARQMGKGKNATLWRTYKMVNAASLKCSPPTI